MEMAEHAPSTPEVQLVSARSKGHGRRLTQGEQGLVLRMHELGKTGHEIAQVLDCADSTVSRTLDQLQDNRALARRQLEASAPKLVQTIVKSKDAATALKALGKLDVVREDAQSGGNQMVVMLGSQDAPLAPPMIDVIAQIPNENGVGASAGDSRVVTFATQNTPHLETGDR